MALSNLGGEYLQIGEFAEAMETLQQSLALDPDSDLAAANTSLAFRYQGKYEKALPFARKAVELNPALDTNWLELADCHSSLPNHQTKQKRLCAGREGGGAPSLHRSGRWPELDAACSLQGEVG